MRKRTALLVSLFIFSLFFTFSQVSLSVADAKSRPLTSPMTTPLTSFMHKISGKITVKRLTWKHLFSRFQPASGVTVKLINTKTNDAQTAQTDSNGTYTFFVTKNGLYKVTPKITHATADIVAPPFRFVTVKKHDKLHEDFQAIDLP